MDMSRFVIFPMTVAVFLLAGLLQAKEIKSGFCKDLQLENIPLVRLDDAIRMPMEEMRVTQEYNNSLQEGWCDVGGSQPPSTSPVCQGQKIYYGHDGLDLHPEGAGSGQTDIIAIQNSLVLASHKSGTFEGWGESVILVTRANEFSEELITFHYHHLHAATSPYATSRLYNACEPVQRGAVIAKEGGTPGWPTHLHFSVKRWDNLKDLQNNIDHNPGKIYGQGYTFGDDSKLANYLDPQALLYDYFTEFQEDQANFPAWQWSLPYLKEMRYQGWYLGDYNGNYGVDVNVKRREAARWIKQAIRLETATQAADTAFFDVQPADRDYPYINSLLAQDSPVMVVNPAHSCTEYGKNFCPDQEITRAESLKMVIAGFFPQDFLDLYNNWIWKAAAPLANDLLSRFYDVSAYSWYAPYVYLAWQKGLTGGGSIFNPDQPVKRAELAKWIVMANQLKTGAPGGYCLSVYCQDGYYCEESSKSCQLVPFCVPREGLSCPLGGGYSLSGSAECVYPQEELKLCPGGTEATYHVCQSDGHWTPWNPPCFDNPPDGGTSGQGGSAGTGGAGGSTNTGGSGNSGTGGSGGSTNTGGSGNSGAGSSGGSSACQAGYVLSPSGASCYTNSASSGSPTLCLETQSGSGSQASWRLCKQGGNFQNNFDYELLDQNHLSHYLSGVLSGQSGSTCTAWKTADFSYLAQNGPANGAGLIVEVYSPSGCASPACTYHTGITTLYRECN
jgi:hypothetical protein